MATWSCVAVRLLPVMPSVTHLEGGVELEEVVVVGDDVVQVLQHPRALVANSLREVLRRHIHLEEDLLGAIAGRPSSKIF